MKLIFVAALLAACVALALTMEGDPCTTGADCRRLECCVSIQQPIGRRKRQVLPGGSAPGTCQRRPKFGELCIVLSNNAVNSDPNGLLFSCPCKGPRSYCQGSGNFIVPLGETGVCRRSPRD